MCVSLIAINFVLAGQSYAAVNLKSAVVLWLFDENTGTVVKDSSGNGNDGKLMNSPAWIAGKFGSALSFDGKSAYVSYPVIKNLAYPFSVCMWVYAADFKQDAIFLSCDTGGVVNFAIGSYGTVGEVLFAPEAVGKTGTTSSAPLTALTNTAWHHICAVYKSATEQSIFIDGIDKTQKSPSGQYFTPNASNIGSRNNGAERQFNGRVDETMIFSNTILTISDAQTIMKGIQSVTAVSHTGKLAESWGYIKAER